MWRELSSFFLFYAFPRSFWERGNNVNVSIEFSLRSNVNQQTKRKFLSSFLPPHDWCKLHSVPWNVSPPTSFIRIRKQVDFLVCLVIIELSKRNVLVLMFEPTRQTNHETHPLKSFLTLSTFITFVKEILFHNG